MTYMSHSGALPETGKVSLERVSYEAYRLLQIGFVAAPIIAGLDKFFYMMTNWSQYLAPWAVKMVGGNARGFMLFVGIVEIIAGIGVALKPKYFGYVVAVWLLCIIINLLSTGAYFDIALRDLGLLLGAISLARLAMFYDIGNFGGLMRHEHRV